MHGVVQKVAQFKIYSTFDMSNAYHQVEIPVCDRMYTPFKLKDRFGIGKEFSSD